MDFNAYKVSIITPIYNAERFIGQAASSLFLQDHSNIEYIFVNDCSSDNSMGILRETIKRFPSRIPGIKILENSKNIGPAAARNRALEIIGGDYWTAIDADDWIEPDMVSTLLFHALQNEADLVWCDCYREKGGKCQYFSQKYDVDSFSYTSGLLEGKLMGYLCNRMYRTEFWKKTDIRINEKLIFCEDLDFNLRLSLQQPRLAYLHKAFLHYRYNPRSVTASVSIEQYYSCWEMQNNWKEILPREYDDSLRKARISGISEIALREFDFDRIFSISQDITVPEISNAPIASLKKILLYCVKKKMKLCFYLLQYLLLRLQKIKFWFWKISTND